MKMIEGLKNVNARTVQRHFLVLSLKAPVAIKSPPCCDSYIRLGGTWQMFHFVMHCDLRYRRKFSRIVYEQDRRLQRPLGVAAQSSKIKFRKSAFFVSFLAFMFIMRFGALLWAILVIKMLATDANRHLELPEVLSNAALILLRGSLLHLVGLCFYRPCCRCAYRQQAHFPRWVQPIVSRVSCRKTLC